VSAIAKLIIKNRATKVKPVFLITLFLNIYEMIKDFRLKIIIAYTLDYIY